MKKIALLALFVALVTSALAIGPSDQEEGQEAPRIFRGYGLYASSSRIVLLKAVTKEESNSEGVQIIPPPRGHDTVRKGTLKIEMLDGSVQEIPILKVKRAMIDYEF